MNQKIKELEKRLEYLKTEVAYQYDQSKTAFKQSTMFYTMCGKVDELERTLEILRRKTF